MGISIRKERMVNMKLKEFFKNFFQGIRSGISRFSIAFICSVSDIPDNLL